MTLTDPRMAVSEAKVMVGIGDYVVGRDPMASIGLGSCVALILHDESRSVGGMAHIMLPCSQGRSERPGKFADTAVDILYRELQSLGVKSGSVIAKLAGGACMFKTFNGNLGIGERNIEAVRDQVRKRGIKIRGEDVGGTSGRSLVYFPSDKGQILVRKADGSITEL